MPRRKPKVCACGHEIAYWHDPLTGECLAGTGRNAKGEAAGVVSAFGIRCPCVRKVKAVNGAKTQDARTTRTVTVRGERVIRSLRTIRGAFMMIAEELGVLLEELDANGHDLPAILEDATTSLAGPAAPRSHAPPLEQAPAARPRASHSARPDSPPSFPGAMSNLRRALLTVLAQARAPLPKRILLIRAGYRSSGDTSSEFAALVRDELVDGTRGELAITEAGLAALGPFTPLPTGRKLYTHVLEHGKLSTVERALLVVLGTSPNETIGKGEILDRACYASSGDTSSAFAKLVALGYADRTGRGALRLGRELRDYAAHAVGSPPR